MKRDQERISDFFSTSRPLVLVDADDRHREQTRESLDCVGFEVVAVASPLEVEQALGVDLVHLIVVHVSPAGDALAQERTHAWLRALRSVTKDRWPLVLHGDRARDELETFALTAGAYAVVAEGDDLPKTLRRLLPDAPLTRHPPPRSAEEKTEPELPDGRVLIVDDSEAALLVMQAAFSGAGFDVRIAMALAEVDSLVKMWRPELVVVDVNMPDIQGDALCARLKARVGRPESAVVLCSSMPDDELADLARAAGADGHVSKGDGIAAMVALVRSLLRERRQVRSRSGTYSFQSRRAGRE
jgi:DNA-binding response OmpR family regulator